MSDYDAFFRGQRAPVYALHGAGASSHPLASAEIVSVLRAGGSAADAAIAAAAVQCVVEPHMTGIGGDCFVMVKAPNAPPQALNGSGWCAAAQNAETFTRQGITALDETSPHTVTVPGAIAAWRELHKRHGRLPWRGLWQAAVAYAENGFPVAARVALDWRRHRARVHHDNDARRVFLPDDTAPTAGERRKHPALAATLKQIAGDGGESFYRGDIARAIIAKLQQGGGVHSTEDFADYQAQWQPPYAARFRNWRVWECAPNGQGLAALLMLNALDKEAPRPLDADGLHRFADITARAYAWRDAHLGDGVPANGLDGVTLPAASDAASPPTPHKDTVYLSVIDGSGLAVSFINSIFHPFGSGIYVPDCGVLLHNRGLSFSLTAGHPNVMAARKRPMHTIIPAIAEGADGEILSFGVMGGHYQAAGHAWFLARLLDDENADIQTALNAPRLFNYPDALWAEPTLAAAWRTALADKGYDVRLCEEPLGGGQAVLRNADKVLVAASDPRKDGCAVGF